MKKASEGYHWEVFWELVHVRPRAHAFAYFKIASFKPLTDYYTYRASISPSSSLLLYGYELIERACEQHMPFNSIMRLTLYFS